MTEAEIGAFHDSFDRCMKQDGRFFDFFYDDFLSSSAEVRRAFAHTDFSRQKRALKLSLILIMNAVVTRSHDFSVLHQVAVKHSRRGANIKPHYYDLWLDSLIRTVEACDDQFDERTESVWRNALQPAIDYIVSKY